jgi:hypothetical protein
MKALILLRSEGDWLVLTGELCNQFGRLLR